MFKKLALRNFQKHTDFTIDLEPITTIVGESDAGKSSVIRALRWLCFNDSQGNAFFHSGTDSCAVKLRVDDIVVTRSKGKENKYVLKQDGVPEEFKAINRDVPLDIQRQLEVFAELNFQSQHDAPFWLCKSAGQLTKELNDIVDMQLMSAVQTTAKSKVQETERDIRNTKDALLKNEVLVQTLAFLPKAYAELDELEALEQSKEAAKEQYEKLQTLLATVQRDKKQYDSLVADREQTGKRMVNCLYILTEQEKVDALKKQCRTLTLFLRLHEESSMPEAPLDLLEQWNASNNKVVQLQTAFAGVKQSQRLYQTAQKVLTDLKKQLDEAVVETPQGKKICPTCNRPL